MVNNGRSTVHPRVCALVPPSQSAEAQSFPVRETDALSRPRAVITGDQEWHASPEAFTSNESTCLTPRVKLDRRGPLDNCVCHWLRGHGVDRILNYSEGTWCSNEKWWITKEITTSATWLPFCLQVLLLVCPPPPRGRAPVQVWGMCVSRDHVDRWLLCIKQLSGDARSDLGSLCGTVYSYSSGPITGTQRESQSAEVNVDNLQRGPTVNAKHSLKCCSAELWGRGSGRGRVSAVHTAFFPPHCVYSPAISLNMITGKSCAIIREF